MMDKKIGTAGGMVKEDKNTEERKVSRSNRAG